MLITTTGIDNYTLNFHTQKDSNWWVGLMLSYVRAFMSSNDSNKLAQEFTHLNSALLWRFSKF